MAFHTRHNEFLYPFSEACVLSVFLPGEGFLSACHFIKGVLLSFSCLFLGLDACCVSVTSIQRENVFWKHKLL